MNEPGLPDLLDALGELFLVPGAFDRARFEALGEASWARPGITQALQALLDEEGLNLDVAYTGLFLQGFDRPTLHLQASAQFAGTLADSALLGELAEIESVAGIHADPSIQPDHLGALLMLLAHLFRELAGATGARASRLEQAAGGLLHRLLLPLSEQVCTGLVRSGIHPFYRAAGRLLSQSLALGNMIVT
jgi:TorA maturation chaperone TorD